MSREQCGVCLNECPHGRQVHGGTEFCIFCLRMHSNHLDAELRALEREKLLVVAENEALRTDKSTLRGSLLAIVNNHESGDELGSGFRETAVNILKSTDWKRW